MDQKHTKRLAAGSIIAAASLAGLAAPAGADILVGDPPLVCGERCEQPGGRDTAFDKWNSLSDAGVFYKVQTVAFPKIEETAFPKIEQTAFPKVETHALFYKISQTR